jgi:hypothetical protein
MAYNGRGFPLGRNRRWTMLKRSPVLPALAVLAILCGVLSEYVVHADDAKPDKKSEAPALGSDWHNLRDGLDVLFEQLQKENGIRASKICDDDTFLRRAYLDLLGRPPLPEEIEAFAPGKRDSKGNRPSEKREALVDELLNSPEHALHFADWWTVVMIGREADGNASRYLHQYLQKAFAENKPWSAITTDLIATKGGKTPENPEIGYLMAFDNVDNDMIGITSKVFMGKQIQCAECHDHPYEHWTQNDFVAMSSFFRLSSVGARGEGADRYWFINDEVPKSAAELDRKVRINGKLKGPTPLGGETWKWQPGVTLREALAAWMTSPDNQWFRNMTVNRYMAYFLGMGFVTPVDDFNAINEPTFPIVLEQMGKDFAASGFDTRYLIRAIMNSTLYQREVDTNRTNRADFQYYSRTFVKRLTPEQIERSILHVIGYERLNPYQPVRDVADDKLTPEEKANKHIRDGVNNWKYHVGRLMRDAYGADPQMYEFGDFDGTLIQALLMMNGNLLDTGHLKNAVTDILARFKSHKDRVEQIYMTVLGRKPTSQDIAIMNGTFANWGSTDYAAYEDLFMALMNTTEFITNS